MVYKGVVLAARAPGASAWGVQGVGRADLHLQSGVVPGNNDCGSARHTPPGYDGILHLLLLRTFKPSLLFT